MSGALAGTLSLSCLARLDGLEAHVDAGSASGGGEAGNHTSLAPNAASSVGQMSHADSVTRPSDETRGEEYSGEFSDQSSLDDASSAPYTSTWAPAAASSATNETPAAESGARTAESSPAMGRCDVTAESGDADVCRFKTSCDPGTARDPLSGTCDPCEPGSYCPGGDASATPCVAGFWDHDASPTSPCIEKSSCNPGQFMLEEGLDATSDRDCRACPSGYFSTSENAAQCVAWTNCSAPDEYAGETPTATADRDCRPCPRYSRSQTSNASECVALSYDMQNAQVVFEAEHFHRSVRSETDDWSPYFGAAASQGQAMEVGPDDHSDWTTDGFLSAPRLDYSVRFQSAGSYFVHVRGDAGAASTGYSDSCYVALDGELSEALTFDSQGGTWGWRSMPISVPASGVHVVSIVAREDGFRADKVVVTSEITPPAGMGPNESPRR